MADRRSLAFRPGAALTSRKVASREYVGDRRGTGTSSGEVDPDQGAHLHSRGGADARRQPMGFLHRGLAPLPHRPPDRCIGRRSVRGESHVSPAAADPGRLRAWALDDRPGVLGLHGGPHAVLRVVDDVRDLAPRRCAVPVRRPRTHLRGCGGEGDAGRPGADDEVDLGGLDLPPRLGVPGRPRRRHERVRGAASAAGRGHLLRQARHRLGDPRRHGRSASAPCGARSASGMGHSRSCRHRLRGIQVHKPSRVHLAHPGLCRVARLRVRRKW